MTFNSVGNGNPNWRSHIFQRGRAQPPTSFLWYKGSRRIDWRLELHHRIDRYSSSVSLSKQSPRQPGRPVYDISKDGLTNNFSRVPLVPRGATVPYFRPSFFGSEARTGHFVKHFWILNYLHLGIWTNGPRFADGAWLHRLPSEIP